MTRFRKALVLGVAVGLLGIGLRQTDLGLRLEGSLGLPFLFVARGPVVPPADVVVVTLDKASARQAGLDTTEWPPPRTVHARVIRALTSSEVSAIVMDVFFERQRSAADDSDLADAIAESGKVVLVQNVDRKRVAGAGVVIEEILSPIDQFQKSAIGLAPFPLPEGPLVHSFWPFFPRTAGETPTLPAVALQIYSLPILSRLLTLVERAGGMDINELPRRVTTIADVERVMKVLRHEFASNSEIAQRVLSLLDATESDDLSATNRRALTALLNLYASSDTQYLNFYGPAGTIKTIPFHQLLESDHSFRLAGKVVFIGEGASELVTSAQQADTYRTVYSTREGVDLSGAEIAATAFANLLTGRMLHGIGPAGSSVLLLGFGISASVLARTLPGFHAIGLTALLGAAYAASAGFLFARHALLVPLVIPLLIQLPLTIFVGVFSRYRDIRKLVPTEADPHARLQVVHGVCLVTDISGYTRLADSVPPEELSKLGELLDHYFDVIRKVVTSRGGMFWGREGDSSMVFWKGQVVGLSRLTWLGMRRKSDKALRLDACLAAIELHDAINRFNAQRPLTQQVTTRIGLDAGEVGFGPISGALQPFGPATITATRIEQRKLSNRPIASSAVVRDLDGLVLRPLGPVRLSDKRDETRTCEVFEIWGQVGTAKEPEPHLREQFAAGLELVEKRRWSDAASIFEELAVAYPDDGPVAYYRDRCEAQREKQLNLSPSLR